ncbi:Peptidase T2, asparaginase 2 [Ascosphaera apis ARSEF 7405]|uniref:Peptidase T2, asparaginase 2 n=1 Tax=Ascosphaera apis ARSEF 7405 TaxID=392613 RepID=A0A167ZK81_9EURO|nr:Peptidase T2, asparaginase 2 [Ascosphaera apis ARSEF 7405]
MVSSKRPALFKPTVIIHGGAGSIERSRLPPELWAKYHASLQAYLRSTYQLLNDSKNDEVENGALNAVTHAVSLLEDDELFNCGRGSSTKTIPTRRALAVSGTGNGDSFLRVNAARTALAMARFGGKSLTDAVTAVSGPGGELQQSAGDRWKVTGEGSGGMIGIEVEVPSKELASASTSPKELYKGVVAWDINCGGMFRAWMEEGEYGEDVERVMVFRDEYR